MRSRDKVRVLWPAQLDVDVSPNLYHSFMIICLHSEVKLSKKRSSPLVFPLKDDLPVLQSTSGFVLKEIQSLNQERVHRAENMEH